MMYQATLINDQGCEFDSLNLVFPRSSKACATAMKTIKQWATLRGGRYMLSVCEPWSPSFPASGDEHDIIAEFSYSGKCRKAVAL